MFFLSTLIHHTLFLIIIFLFIVCIFHVFLLSSFVFSFPQFFHFHPINILNLAQSCFTFIIFSIFLNIFYLFIYLFLVFLHLATFPSFLPFYIFSCQSNRRLRCFRMALIPHFCFSQLSWCLVLGNVIRVDVVTFYCFKFFLILFSLSLSLYLSR